MSSSSKCKKDGIGIVEMVEKRKQIGNWIVELVKKNKVGEEGMGKFIWLNIVN